MAAVTANSRQRLTALAACDVGICLWDEPLDRHCTWRIGGPADLLVEPDHVDKVARIVRYANHHKIPLVVIGQGSNLLFDDAGVRGIVMKIGRELSTVTIDGHRILAEGGAWVPGVARCAMQHGLAGLEHIIGIPGTLGGLILMNGGSQRRAIGDNVQKVWIVSRDGKECCLPHAACHFSYRQSALQDTGAVVTRVELTCPTGDRREIRRAMLADLRERRRKFPRKQPNCGSVFLSTAEMHASVGPPGKIIEDAGLKGSRVGDAEVSRQHANFIVNLGQATSRDVLALINQVRCTVHKQIGFTLYCEARYVSPDGVILPADRMLESSTAGLSR